MTPGRAGVTVETGVLPLTGMTMEIDGVEGRAETGMTGQTGETDPPAEAATQNTACVATTVNQ